MENITLVTTCLRVGVERIINLRHQILRPGLPVETAHFDGDEEKDTFHFGCFILSVGPDPLCCVTYKKSEYNTKPAWQLRGMATRKDFQGKKLGSILTAEAEIFIAKETGIDLFWCNARVEAVPFYKKIGWSSVSEVFDIPGVGPHVKMVKL